MPNRVKSKNRVDIWQAKTVRRKRLVDGDRRSRQRADTLKRDALMGVEYFWSNRPRPSHLK